MLGIDVAAYAIMSKHFHVALYADQAEAKALSDDEVINRWLLLQQGNHVYQKYCKDAPAWCSALVSTTVFKRMALTSDKHQLVYAALERSPREAPKRRDSKHRRLLGEPL